MQTNRRKIPIELIRTIDMLLSFFARVFIFIVVSFVIGTNSSPTLYQIIIIDVAMIWWTLYPVIKFYIDNNDK